MNETKYGLDQLDGIGDKTKKVFFEHEIYSAFDVLNTFPTRYEVFHVSSIEDAKDQDKVCIECNVSALPIMKPYSKAKAMTFEVISENKNLNAIIYNREFYKNKLTIGRRIILSGKYEKYQKRIVVGNIFFDDFTESITPIYSIDVPGMSKIMRSACNLCIDRIYETLPKEYLQKYHLMDKKTLYRAIHFPVSEAEIHECERRLKYEELLQLEVKWQYYKKLHRSISKMPKKYDISLVKEFISSLPFELTEDQKKATNEIFIDFKQKYPMNRLIEGDVGSGKTVVAMIASYAVVTSHMQVAILAPTEILAQQHYQSFCKFLAPFGVRIELLTSSTKKSVRETLLNQLRFGEIDILIGTHSIISKDCIFKNLGFFVADEQHRFGVEQRSILKQKGISPDALFMTATPIPRTLGLALFGDLDVSYIRSMPNGRIPVITKVVEESRLPSIYKFMISEIKKDHTIYIVCPLIEQNGELDVSNVLETYQEMQAVFKDVCDVALLHGKMKPMEKKKSIEDFMSHKKPVLVSTTVIEVGVDSKDATVIFIKNAERFGLAQLHQLRGRVGRNSLQCYCILQGNKEDKKRLSIMEATSDGFTLAEEDLKLRGIGELLGERQSGQMHLKYASLKEDMNILERALEDAKDLIYNPVFSIDPEYRELYRIAKDVQKMHKGQLD